MMSNKISGKAVGSYDKLSMTATGKKASGTSGGKKTTSGKKTTGGKKTTRNVGTQRNCK